MGSTNEAAATVSSGAGGQEATSSSMSIITIIISRSSNNNNIQCIISNGLVTLRHRKSMTLPTPIMLLGTIISQQPLPLQELPQTTLILAGHQVEEVKIPIIPPLLMGQQLLLLLKLKIMQPWALLLAMEEVMVRPRVRRPHMPTIIILHTVSDLSMKKGGHVQEKNNHP